MSVDDRLHGLTSRYMSSPQWLKSMVGGVYAIVPRRLRHGSAYARFLEVFRRGADGFYIHQHLSETLTAAVRNVPAFQSYRALLPQIACNPLDALKSFPYTQKSDIKRQPDRYLNSAMPTRDAMVMFTGGSTAVPMRFYLQRGAGRAKELAAFDLMAERLDISGKGIVLALRGQTVPRAGSGRIWMYEPIKQHLIVSSDHLEPRFMEQYVEALRRWRPRYVQAFPSALYPLLIWLRENGQENLLSQVRSVTLFSESVFEHHMQAFRQFFECPVMVHYGHTERVVFATTLPEDSRYHVWPHYGYTELVDTSGRQVTEPGRSGEIVGTSFDNLVMPFVRYRTGDFAVLGSDPHPTMKGCMVLDRIEGRLQEFVVCSDHRLITVTTLGAAHIREFDQCLRIQYEQSEPGRITVRVMTIHPLDNNSRERICSAIEEKTQGGCRVKLEEVDSIELTQRGKQRLLIQNLNLEDYLGASMDRT